MSVDHGVETSGDLTTVCTTNDEGFARIIRLYARPGAIIVDPTFGNGVFWRAVDRSQFQVLTSDLKSEGVDLRELPHGDETADMVVIDPPYRYTPAKNRKHEDSPGHGAVDGLYNLQGSGLKNTQAVLELYYAGMAESYRVLKLGGFLVLKCQDTVQDGRNIWVHTLLLSRGEVMGFACRDMLVVTPPSVTKSRWDRQRHLRKAHSYFLVFRKGGHFPFGMPSVCKR